MTRLLVYSLMIGYLHVYALTTTKVEWETEIVPVEEVRKQVERRQHSSDDFEVQRPYRRVETCGGMICGNDSVCSIITSRCICQNESLSINYNTMTRKWDCIDKFGIDDSTGVQTCGGMICGNDSVCSIITGCICLNEFLSINYNTTTRKWDCIDKFGIDDSTVERARKVVQRQHDSEDFPTNRPTYYNRPGDIKLVEGPVQGVDGYSTSDDSTQTYDDIKNEAWGLFYYAIGGFFVLAMSVFIGAYVTHKKKKAKKARIVPVVPEDDRNTLTTSDPLAYIF